MDNGKRSHNESMDALFEETVSGPLERAVTQDTDPLTLLDMEEALRLIDEPKVLRNPFLATP